MSRPIKFSEGEYYHVFNRGVEKRVVFKDLFDKIRFQKLMFLCNSEHMLHLSILKEEIRGDNIYSIERGRPLVAVGAYCIMNNHFHILLKEITNGGISRFMQKLSTAYTMYFNIRNQRTGSLFEGRFRAKQADSNDYLKYLFSYIHLNPVEHIEPKWKEQGIRNMKKVWNYACCYSFSSIKDFLDHGRPEKIILSLKSFPSYFETNESVQKEIQDWLMVKPENFKTW